MIYSYEIITFIGIRKNINQLSDSNFCSVQLRILKPH